MADLIGPVKQWLKPRMSFGPIPSPRHSATVWSSDDRFFYVYGGETSVKDETERDLVYRLDTSIFSLAVPSHRCVFTPFIMFHLEFLLIILVVVVFYVLGPLSLDFISVKGFVHI
jgi:hypothetical protein